MPTSKNAPGTMLLTYEFFLFYTKSYQPPFFIRIYWPNIKEIGKGQRKNFDKSLTITTLDDAITFASLKDRDTLMSMIELVRRASAQPIQTYGFSKKDDDAEVIRRINVLKAPYVFKDSVSLNLTEIMSRLRDGSLAEAMLTACGCTGIVISPWERTENGISRTVQYVQPMSQNANVSAVHTLMKSGSVGTFEIASSFSRVNSGKFLETQLQFYFKEASDQVDFRGAYVLEWLKDIWDKEFVEASVSRANRIMFYYLHSTFSQKPFEVAKYEGKWSLHQPYVLVIFGLIAIIICVGIFPRDTDWYKLIAGIIVLAALFYL
jgi:hypothetical protein